MRTLNRVIWTAVVVSAVGFAVLVYLDLRDERSEASQPTTTTVPLDPALTDACYWDVTYWSSRLIDATSNDAAFSAEMNAMVRQFGTQSQRTNQIREVWRDVTGVMYRQGIDAAIDRMDRLAREACGLPAGPVR